MDRENGDPGRGNTILRRTNDRNEAVVDGAACPTVKPARNFVSPQRYLLLPTRRSRGRPEGARRDCRQVRPDLQQRLKDYPARKGLKLNGAKTRLLDANRESFRFLGFEIGMKVSPNTGGRLRWTPALRPSRSYEMPFKMKPPTGNAGAVARKRCGRSAALSRAGRTTSIMENRGVSPSRRSPDKSLLRLRG